MEHYFFLLHGLYSHCNLYNCITNNTRNLASVSGLVVKTCVYKTMLFVNPLGPAIYVCIETEIINMTYFLCERHI